MLHKYTFGNSPDLPNHIPSEDPAMLELVDHLKDVYNIPDEEPLFFVISTKELHPFQVSKIEHALMNPVPNHVI